MPINVTCPACSQSVAAPETMAGKKAVCPNCRAAIAVPEMLPVAVSAAPVTSVQAAPKPASDREIPTSLDISNPAPTDTQAEDEKAALRVLRIVFVFFRDDWRRLLTCPHLWLVFVLFFLPWVNLSCNGRTLVTQTGMQTCFGTFTVDARLEKAARDHKGLQNDLKERPPWSLLSMAFIAFVFLGGLLGVACMVCVVLRMSTLATATHLFSLGLGSAAFLALTAQMTIGFPIDRHFKQQVEKQRAEQERQNPPGVIRDAGDAWIDVDTRYTFWLWLACLITFLSAPVFLLEFVILIAQAVKHHAGQRDDSG